MFAAARGLLDLFGIKSVVTDQKWIIPFDDEWLDGREIAQSKINGKSVFCFVPG